MITNNDAYSALGTWADEDFEGTVLEHSGVGSDVDMPDEVRFVAGVVKLLQRRIAEIEAEAQSDDTDIAIFVLKPKPPDSVAGAESQPMVGNGLTKLIGRLWFTAAPVASAHYVDLPEDTNDSGRISYVADVLHLGSLPTLIFDPRTQLPELRWYPEGLNDLNNVEVKHLHGDVSPVEVFATIDRLYYQCFVTPGTMAPGGNLWRDSAQSQVRQNAEALVQAQIKAGLATRFPFCTIRHEQPQPSGRTDLEIEQPDPRRRGSVTRFGILELKVLRSFGSTGIAVSATQNQEWIRGGVQQAAAYRNEKHAKWSALCCFDMRTVNPGDYECFAHIRDNATAFDVQALAVVPVFER